MHKTEKLNMRFMLSLIPSVLGQRSDIERVYLRALLSMFNPELMTRVFKVTIHI